MQTLMLARTAPRETWAIDEHTICNEYRMVFLNQGARVDLAEHYNERELLWSPEASAIQRRCVRTYTDGRVEATNWTWLVFAKSPRDALLRMFDGDWWKAESLHPAHAWVVSRHTRLAAFSVELTKIEEYVERPKGRAYNACEEHWNGIYTGRLKDARLYTALAKNKLSEAQRKRVQAIKDEVEPQMIADRQQHLDRRATLKAQVEAIEAEPMPAIQHPYAYKEDA